MPVQARKGSRNGMVKTFETRLMPLLARFRAIWGGLAGTRARSSISCRCESLRSVNADTGRPEGVRLLRAGTAMRTLSSRLGSRCALALTTPITQHSDLSQSLVNGPVTAQMRRVD